jgi:fatty acid desaturase
MEHSSQPVSWYRTKLDRATMDRLNAKSDVKGFIQTLGHLGILALCAGLALYGVGRWPWWLVLILVFLYGMVASFAINAVHELVHKSVFKTQALNRFFVRVYAFLGWIHFEHFYRSHVRHHQFTLHPPDDQEVLLPLRVLVKDFFKTGFLHLRGMEYPIKTTLRLARGKFEGEWEKILFPADKPELSKPIVRWARTLLVGHTLILLVSLYFGWYLVPVLVSLSPMYGSWLFFLCNNTQHIGLQDNVSDFRLCCRTFTVNPVVQFLYWHMNFHIEHHMYAAVPCYHLAALHRAILHDLPYCPNGIIATWKEIAMIQHRQARDPSYQHVVILPEAKREGLHP